ncbi:hypothetical protein K501DRAFT_323123 [Backusella circina FSU 941]|nr:hypothetical protein K501DRAFT_323123 [Backusella circina FSU 941]
MTSTTYPRYYGSDEDSAEWSSDPAPRRKRRNTRTTKKKSSITSNASESQTKSKVKKPGRKPLDKVTVLPSDPKLKRKAQNRAAQRAFRERKEKFVTELQEQIRQIQEEREEREKKLTTENEELRKELEKLREENSILKDSNVAAINFSDKSSPVPLVSPPVTDDQAFSSSAESSPDLYGSSPLSNDPLSDYYSEKSLSETELSPFNGAIPTERYNQFSDFTGFASIPTDQNTVPLADDKTDLFFPDYRTSSNDNDFMIQNDTLPSLFGSDIDLFGLNSPAPLFSSELDPMFSEQMQAIAEQNCTNCTSNNNKKPYKASFVEALRRAKGAGRRLDQVTQEVKENCPDFNLDSLCEDLRRKITFDSGHILSDAEVELYIECMQRNN